MALYPDFCPNILRELDRAWLAPQLHASRNSIVRERVEGRSISNAKFAAGNLGDDPNTDGSAARPEQSDAARGGSGKQLEAGQAKLASLDVARVEVLLEVADGIRSDQGLRSPATPKPQAGFPIGNCCVKVQH